MKLEGRIIVAQPIQSGVSKNGNNWQRQDFVLEIPGQYPKKVAFSVMNSNIQNFGLAVGQDVDIEIDINANEWQGRWFTPLLAGKQHSVIRDSLPRHNSPKLIIREHHPPRHPHKTCLNHQWISGNKKTICLSKKGEGSRNAPFFLLMFHFYDFIINYSASWVIIDYCLFISLCTPSPP